MGDTDYETIGACYSSYRMAEPTIAELIEQELAAAVSVLNVGAGAGSYEPRNRQVTAVEPSATMRRQRPVGLSAAVDAVAEQLPFPDRSFDASMATFTVHQWSNLHAGLSEMRRVTRGPIVILTCDPDLVQQFWLSEYAPDVLAAEARRYPPLGTIKTILGSARQMPVPIPLWCRDGFNEAYYGRPEKFLDAKARQACSAWNFVEPAKVASYVERLSDDLAQGSWDAHHGKLRSQSEFMGSLYLMTAI